MQHVNVIAVLSAVPNLFAFFSKMPILVRRLTSPFSTKIGYIRDKILGGDLVPPG